MPEEKFHHFYLTNAFQFNENLMLIFEFQNTICDNGNCDTKFGDALEVHFDLNKKQNLTIKKIQTTLKGEKPICIGGTMSFVPFQSNKLVYLLYNCNRQCEISEDGNIGMKNIFDSSIDSNLAILKYSFRMNNEELLVLTYSKKTGHRFTKLSFKE